MTRRGFLWLCGASGAAIYFARPAMAAAGESPRRFVPLRTGRCSFCGKSRRELGGLVGIPGRPEKACDECTPCLLDLIATSPEAGHSVHATNVHCSFCDRHRREVRLMFSGPRVFICDDCTIEAATVLEANGARFTPSSDAIIAHSSWRGGRGGRGPAWQR
jgi:hypothetical protein